MDESERHELKKICRIYEKMCIDTRVLDFDDMILRCRDILYKHESILKKWQSRYRYILVDEFQDINDGQYDVLRLLAGDSRIDASRVAVTGSSRLGKASLLAAACDIRFAAVVLNQTGGGGVPLSKRDFGEHVRSEVEHYTHWWSPEFAKYAGKEKSMPFDQHLLLSCIAPRPLLVEGFDNPWFDTYGEFLALRAAAPVWSYLGATSLPENCSFPEDYDTSCIGRTLGYVRRPGAHGYAPLDWKWLLDFLDTSLRLARD